MIEAHPGTRPVIVRLRNFVGDVVLGIPALRLLERHGYQPWLVGKGWAPGLLAAEGWRVEVRPKKLLDRVAQLRALRREALQVDPDFDRRPNALALPWAFSAALDMRLAGLRAVGYAHESRGWLLHRSHPMPPPMHALMNYWQLACLFLGLDAGKEPPPAAIELKVSEAQRAAADEVLRAAGVREGYVLICPFSGGTFEQFDKTWPHFPAFLDLLATRGRDIVVCPVPARRPRRPSAMPRRAGLRASSWAPTTPCCSAPRW